jgi:hypothetical protein
MGIGEGILEAERDIEPHQCFLELATKINRKWVGISLYKVGKLFPPNFLDEENSDLFTNE